MMKYEKKVFRERLEISARVVETIFHPIFPTATHRMIASGIQWEISPISGGKCMFTIAFSDQRLFQNLPASTKFQQTLADWL